MKGRRKRKNKEKEIKDGKKKNVENEIKKEGRQKRNKINE